MFTQELISTDKNSTLQVSFHDDTIFYTVKPKSLFKILFKLLRGESIQFIATKGGK